MTPINHTDLPIARRLRRMKRRLFLELVEQPNSCPSSPESLTSFQPRIEVPLLSLAEETRLYSVPKETSDSRD